MDISACSTLLAWITIHHFNVACTLARDGQIYTTGAIFVPTLILTLLTLTLTILTITQSLQNVQGHTVKRVASDRVIRFRVRDRV